MTKRRPVVLAIVSDLHAGSQLAPCPPSVRLDDGGNYIPSKAQRWLWGNWENFWAQVKEARKGCDLYVVCNGDAVEGDHHRSTQILSGNLEAQSYVVQQMWKVARKAEPDKLFIVRGTEVHTGPAASHEEAMARELKAEQDRDTHTWSWWHLRMNIHGVKLDFQHHCNVSGLPWTAAGAIARLAFRTFSAASSRAARTGKPIDYPHLMFRSHVHCYHDSFAAHPVRAIVTPPWQLKTAHAHKAVPDAVPVTGGIIARIEPSGVYSVRSVLYHPDPPTPWVA